MTKENKNKAVLLTLLCVWPGFLLMANEGYSGWLLTTVYLMWLAATVFIGKYLLHDKPIRLANGTNTPLYDVTLKNLGFRWNNEHERWQIGCIGAPCFIFYNPTSSCSVPNMIECFNFVSGNDEHLVRLVHSSEEIRLVLNACGITEGMIEEAQEKWKQ